MTKITERFQNAVNVLKEVENLLAEAKNKGAKVVVVIENEEPAMLYWFYGIAFLREWKKEWEKYRNEEGVIFIDESIDYSLTIADDIADKISEKIVNAYMELGIDLAEELVSIAEKKYGMRVVYTI